MVVRTNGVGCQQQMIALMRTARMTEVMHGTSFQEILVMRQVAASSAVHTQEHKQRQFNSTDSEGSWLRRQAIAKKSSLREFFPRGS